MLTDDGSLLDISVITPDIDAEFLACGGLDAIRLMVEANALPRRPPAGDTRVGPPIARPGKVVCIGVNYRDHAAETGHPTPAEPVVFLKAADTVIGPDDEVLIPRGSTKTDYEAELAVVIGRTARYLTTSQEGLAHIAGYTISHDVSEREFQLERGGQWDKGKSCETFNPLGPLLVTADSVDDPQNLAVRLWVNGTVRQNGHTRDMIFPVGEIVRYLSHFMVLHPGDVINTGTPAGVALGHPHPQPYLRCGDRVDIEIAGLGRQQHTMGQA
ncbi:putative decarboxylase [Streptomyces viridochromogenes Tue57]|uniref:Putative decarboxylase n=1 Tax=Streptomyces viridochromogenes Tue57 TaxID=1160705 RepID=L8PP12_STRVR|nr:putative decarboxylase [Streptomyces viridochromogenes Tue57]